MNQEINLESGLQLIKEEKTSEGMRRAIVNLIQTLKFDETIEGVKGDKKDLAETETLFADAFTEILALSTSIESGEEKRSALLELVRTVPPRGLFVDIFIEAIKASLASISEMSAPRHRRSSLLRLAEEVPRKPDFRDIFDLIIREAIKASDEIEDLSVRRRSILEITRLLLEREECKELRLHAYKVALGLTGVSNFNTYSPNLIAKELPKSCDYTFYRENTFLGLALSLPKSGEFLELLKEALLIAVEASSEIEEPFYRRYALWFIANEVYGDERFSELYKKIVRKSFESSLLIKDPFPRQFALLEMLRELPREAEFSELIFDIIEAMLPFFSAKSRFGDVGSLEVLDYLLVAEEKRMTDSKKNRYTRDHYGLQFADILLELNSALGDIRLVEILKPYSHVWIRPPKFRETIREIIAELTKLRETYTGFETEKPEFTGETHPEPKSLNTEKSKASVTPLNDLTETIAVDLGATNTVVMQRLAGKDAEPLDLATASINIDGLRVIPTLLDASEEKIGKEVDPSKGVENIKGLALENDQAGRDSIKEFITLLSTRITSARGGEEKGKDSWLTRRFSSTSKDTPRLVLTVPVGFDDYRSLIKESFTLSSPEAEVELIEEPLAAAIGYQVATKEDKLVLVLDFGGCTLDVMLLRLKDNELHVVAKPDQSNRLGGRDIDLWLAKYLAKKARGEADEGSKELILIAEEIKKTLSTHEAAPFLWKGQKIEDITRFDFEDVLEENGFYKSVDRTVGYVLGKAKKLGITPEMIEAVVLTGGSSLIPSFKDKLGDLFPELLARNEIYDHSPFSAVAGGASVYGTSLVTDRHLGVACALRYTARNAGAPFSYEIVLEKGDHLPIKKSYLLRPAKTLGTQDELSIELFEIPESFVTRRWVLESGMEFIKQILKPLKDRPDFRAFKSTRIKINDKDLDDDGRFPITFSVDLSGKLKLVCGEDNTEIETGLHLQ